MTPDFYHRNRRALVDEPFLLIDGELQNQDNAISVKARRIQPLAATAAVESRDFH